MAASALVPQEPLGIVIRDGGEAHRPPRIWMYFWASEEGTDEVERRDH